MSCDALKQRTKLEAVSLALTLYQLETLNFYASTLQLRTYNLKLVILMSNILPFRKPSRPEKHKGKVLCMHGRHKWVVEKESQFDVKQGRLVTLYRCSRCGATMTKAL